MAKTSSPAYRRMIRCALLTSVVPFAAQAQAQAQDRPDFTIEAPHAAPGIAAAPLSVVPAGLAPEAPIHEPQVVINPPSTPTTARDTKDITGVGQMFINQGGGSLSLCTGTLVNPRMVIFAAHCVNSSAASAYGTQSGDKQIAFGFKADNLQGVRDWLFGNATTGVTAFRSTPSNALFNVNQVSYLEASLKPEYRSFLQADVAVASLDTPAVGIPAWALLFSALPAPSAISPTTGTGYHVTVTGYGRNGSGPTGDTGGIDYRRRSAENYLGALASLSDVDLFLFGDDSRSLNQNLYMTDLDDPRRGTASASPYDFNLFKDTALPNEGITAGGDSGGPLILDRTYSKPVVLGVLSGGTRYYNAQPSSSYGTTSFYQPLYLYWDYIVATNPYRYVSAKAGDGKWSDANHWVTELDPSYQVLSGGNLVNGLPTTAGLGEAGSGGSFGQLCFDTRTSSECQDLSTGIIYVNGVATGQVAADPAAPAGAALPAATLANGRPGATNFVPNNTDPNKTTGAIARYFDVTLGAAGTTTLDTAVTVDRLSIANSGARLNVTSTGSLTSLIEINQLIGQTNVDGRIRSGGDYFLFGGLLSGSGRVDTPFLTSVTGTIAPGTLGTAGTLTVGGNLILASGSQLLIDIAGGGVSDRIAVIGTTATDGRASVGGSVQFAPVAGSTVRYNDVYTIVTAERGLVGRFAAPAALSAILRPTLVYGATSVTARIDAGTYASVVADTPIQTAFARLLDQNRGNYAALSGTYGILDLQNQATIRSSLEGLAPRAEVTKRSIGTVATDNIARFYRERLAAIDPSKPLGGSLTMIGSPSDVVVGAIVSPGVASVQADSAATTVREGVLPDDTSAFLTGGYIRGSAPSMPTALPVGGRDEFDGFYIAGGVEKSLSDEAVLGFGLSYSSVEGQAQFGQQAKGDLIQGTLYMKTRTPGGLTTDFQFGAGVYQSRTTRNVALATTPFTLKARDNALTISSEFGVAYLPGNGPLHFGPRIAFRSSTIGFTPTSETGGGPALRYDEDTRVSLQGRGGAVLDGTFGGFRPFASGYYVREFREGGNVFTGNFNGGIGSSVAFALPSTDDEWGEIGGGFAFGSDRVELSIAADTTIARDIRNQSYRGTIKVRF